MSTNPRVAVYAGSFDPVHKGHVWLIRTAAAMFDKVYVVLAHNPDKKPMFEHSTMRMQLIEDAIAPYELNNVWIKEASYNTPTAVKAKDLGARYLIRGLRSASDFDYERGLQSVNATIAADLQTVFLAPPADLAHISSSAVREIHRCGGWDILREYVPRNVWARMLEAMPSFLGAPDAILDCYRGRPYHNLAHIAEMLMAYQIREWVNPGEVLMAIWYHDAICVPNGKDNERQSAHWAVKDIDRLGLPQDAKIVRKLILATDYSRPCAKTTDCVGLRQIDCASALMDDPEVEWAVWREYADLCKGDRAKFLKARAKALEDIRWALQ